MTIWQGTSLWVVPSSQASSETTDFSDGTTDALSYAFSLAREYQVGISVLHVLDDLGMIKAPAFRESRLDSLRNALERLVPEARSWCDVTTTLATGTPYQVILKTVKKDKVGLLVMNVHGKGMWERALVGSTAERVVRAADCPVLLIPPLASTVKARLRSRKGRAA